MGRFKLVQYMQNCGRGKKLGLEGRLVARKTKPRVGAAVCRRLFGDLGKPVRYTVL